MMDKKTSEICRSMHGRIIPAGHLENQADKIINAKTMAQKKAAATWQSKAYNGRSDKLASNFGLPPYHFRCRTEVVPVWVEGVEIDGVKMKNTSPLSRDESLKHIDKMGVERVWKKSNTHIKDKHQIKPSEAIKALNSITKIAPNKEKPLYTNAVSQNGYFIVFDGEKLVSMYKPSRNLNEYFKDNSKTLEQEIIHLRF
ncbi:hypothetical protein [Campylobacter sputorum]|uniref:hypothetical protein n=1 Tax=Campylobacter sputorum TaxID=206 RepID=UPI001374725A|nr:hypothetical protein [Campylobacter sputorum]